MAEDGECLSECFGSGVEGRVGGAGMDRGCELIRGNACEFDAGVVGSEIDADDEVSSFVEFSEELGGFDACATPAVVVDVGWHRIGRVHG